MYAVDLSTHILSQKAMGFLSPHVNISLLPRGRLRTGLVPEVRQDRAAPQLSQRMCARGPSGFARGARRNPWQGRAATSAVGRQIKTAPRTDVSERIVGPSFRWVVGVVIVGASPSCAIERAARTLRTSVLSIVGV